MTQTTTAIQDVVKQLSQVTEPEKGKNLIELRMIKDVSPSGDAVKVVVETIGDHFMFRSKVETDIKAKVCELTWVNHVDVIFEQRAAQLIADPIALPNIKNIIVVSSGKGGVGKSTSSVYIAKALAATGLKVGLLDADAYGPNIPNILDCYDVPEQKEKNLIPVRTDHIRFISMGSLIPPDQAVIWRGPMLHKLLKQFFADVDWGELDYLVIDMPPGTGDVQLSIVQFVPLSGAIVVTTPQALSIADVRKGIRMFQDVHVPILGLVENMSYFMCDHCQDKKFIFGEDGGRNLATELNIPFLGQMPLDPMFANGKSNAAIKCFLPVANAINQRLNPYTLN